MRQRCSWTASPTLVAGVLLLLLAGKVSADARNPPSSQSSAPPAIGKVTYLVGKAELTTKDGVVSPIVTGISIPEGSRIHVKERSRLNISLIDGGVEKLGANTLFEFELYRYDPANPQANRIRKNLIEGEVTTKTGAAGEAAKEGYRLNSLLAAIGILGTEYTVRSTQAETWVMVHSGAVSIAKLGEGCHRSGFGACFGGEILTEQQRGLALVVREASPRPVFVPVTQMPPTKTETAGQAQQQAQPNTQVASQAQVGSSANTQTDKTADVATAKANDKDSTKAIDKATESAADTGSQTGKNATTTDKTDKVVVKDAGAATPVAATTNTPAASGNAGTSLNAGGANATATTTTSAVGSTNPTAAGASTTATTTVVTTTTAGGVANPVTAAVPASTTSSVVNTALTVMATPATGMANTPAVAALTPTTTATSAATVLVSTPVTVTSATTAGTPSTSAVNAASANNASTTLESVTKGSQVLVDWGNYDPTAPVGGGLVRSEQVALQSAQLQATGAVKVETGTAAAYTVVASPAAPTGQAAVAATGAAPAATAQPAVAQPTVKVAELSASLPVSAVPVTAASTGQAGSLAPTVATPVTPVQVTPVSSSTATGLVTPVQTTAVTQASNTGATLPAAVTAVAQQPSVGMVTVPVAVEAVPVAAASPATSSVGTGIKLEGAGSQATPLSGSLPLSE